MDICRSIEPPTVAMEQGGEAACHLHTEGPRLAGRSIRELLPTVQNRTRRSRHRTPVDVSTNPI